VNGVLWRQRSWMMKPMSMAEFSIFLFFEGAAVRRLIVTLFQDITCEIVLSRRKGSTPFSFILLGGR